MGKRTPPVRALAACLAALCSLAAGADDPAAAYRSIFGAEERKVSASATRADDVAFATRLLARAAEVHESPRLQALLYEKAYEFGLKDRGGHGAAMEALRRLAALAPQRKAECDGKMLKLCEARYRVARREERISAGRDLLGRLLALGAAAAAAGQTDQAVARYRQAAVLAPRVDPGNAKAVAQRLRELIAREQADKQAARLAEALRADPKNASIARRLLMVHLVDRDDPNRAGELLDAAEPDERLKTCLPLARRRWDELGETPALELAQWYESLAARASPPARPRMLLRAKTWYNTYLALHGSHDAAALKARVRRDNVIKRLRPYGEVTGGMLGPPNGVTGAILAWAKRRDAMPPGEQIKALETKLTELHGANEIRAVSHAIADGRVTYLKFREQEHLRSLAPLYGMRLERLDIERTNVVDLEPLRGMRLVELKTWECKSLRSLKGIEGMPLTALTLTWSQVTDLEPLRGMKLTRLNLTGLRKLASIEPLRGMPLAELGMYDCYSVASLEPLRGMKLRKLHMGVMKRIRRREQLEPLRGMPLTELHAEHAPFENLSLLKGMRIEDLAIYGCKSLRTLDGLEEMPLRTLDLRRTRFATRKTAEELKRRISTLRKVRYRDE